jgi:hypothetical protein
MRRWIVFTALTLASAVSAAAAVAAASGGPTGRAGGQAPTYGRAAYFAIGCGFSHRNQDDAIVFPNQPGRSHDHTYFGNTSTRASSTPASLRGSGTTCRLPEDTAAYWVPTLFSGSEAVRPLGATAYYIRRTNDAVRAFPAGLKIVAGSAAARSPQSLRVTSWSCGFRGREASSSIPTCFSNRRGGLRLQVNFPNCWDGSRLDGANHQSHMAYSSDGECPESHPVEVPALTIVVSYPVAGGAGLELASGGQFSGHGDFVNAWDQRTLEALVDRYLNRLRTGRGRRG